MNLLQFFHRIYLTSEGLFKPLLSCIIKVYNHYTGGLQMETLFIADDEKNIREGLKCILEWETLGFALCGKR